MQLQKLNFAILRRDYTVESRIDRNEKSYRFGYLCLLDRERKMPKKKGNTVGGRIKKTPGLLEAYFVEFN